MVAVLEITGRKTCNLTLIWCSDPDDTVTFALPASQLVMFHDDVRHCLTVHKAAQPGKAYSAGDAEEIRSRVAEDSADGEACPGLPVKKSGSVHAPPPSSALPQV